MSWLDPLSTLPSSSLFIFFVNFCVVLTSSYVIRRVVDVDRIGAQESQVHRYERSLRDARTKGDRAALRKLKRQEIRFKRISSAASRQRLKVLIITALPFTVVSFLLTVLYSGKEVIRFPFEFMLLSNQFSFSIWYFLTFFTVYLPLSKILRTSPGFWQMFEDRSS